MAWDQFVWKVKELFEIYHAVKLFSEQSESYQENVEKSIEKGIQFVEQNFVKNCPASVVVVFAEKEGSVSTNVMQVVNVNSERNSFDGDSIKS